jgi:2-phospho-L-lactate guanylyltransferase (CobY/MobA/RfbA family)
MTLWAIVPVKPLRRGKSRLAGTLSETERAELNQKLLEQTLTTLSSLKVRPSFSCKPRPASLNHCAQSWR